MRMKRVPSVIKEVSEELNNSVTLLKEYKNELIKDVDLIPQFYNGRDALIIISKFKNYINSMDNIIDNYKYWDNYLKMMSDYDFENVKNTLSSFENTETTIIDHNTKLDNIYNTTLTYGDDIDGEI